MLDVEFSQLSDPGTVRPRNEDYLGYVVTGAISNSLQDVPSTLQYLLNGWGEWLRAPRWRKCWARSGGRRPWNLTAPC